LNNSIARFSVNRQPDEVSDRDNGISALNRASGSVFIPMFSTISGRQGLLVKHGPATATARSLRGRRHQASRLCAGGEFMTHDLENIGDTPLIFATVEFLHSANAPLEVEASESALVA
jgi:hypothetical protein